MYIMYSRTRIVEIALSEKQLLLRRVQIERVIIYYITHMFFGTHEKEREMQALRVE